MNKDFIKEVLTDKGFDGLYVPGECACGIDDLLPCETKDASKCIPGYKTSAPEGSEFAFYIGPDKQQCRICGCTEHNCAGCIKKTGKPCHWTEPDLCSACKGVE